jgi:hypothetical protein
MLLAALRCTVRYLAIDQLVMQLLDYAVSSAYHSTTVCCCGHPFGYALLWLTHHMAAQRQGRLTAHKH